MKTVNVAWEVNTPRGEEDIPLEELGCETMGEWNSLSEEDQEDRLQEALDKIQDRVYIMVDSW